jgi:dTDP-4-dehydrorhamnose 3,5-epimerase
MIDGVKVIPLRKIADERGVIMHMLRSTDEHFEHFGEAYFATAYPGVIKGWHEHTEQTQFYCVVSGMIKLVMYDDREGSPTRGELMEIFMGDLNYVLVRIPFGIINGWKCIGTQTAMVANCATTPHKDGEMLRYPPFGDRVPYKWDIEMK